MWITGREEITATKELSLFHQLEFSVKDRLQPCLQPPKGKNPTKLELSSNCVGRNKAHVGF